MDTCRPESIEPPSNVLLVHATHRTPEACTRLGSAPETTAELRVSFSTERPKRDGGATPSKLGLVSVGDVLRSASADAGPDFTAPIAVDAIDDPGDLAAIGTSVSRFCEQWSGSDERITVCFRSLDAVLRHASEKTAFRFAHVLTNRLANVGALAHFHLDPTVHDDGVVSTFGAIFDEVVVDDSVAGALPEASDEEVAAILSELDDGDDRLGRFEDGIDEATDEDVARLLGE